MHTHTVRAYGTEAADTPLHLMDIPRRELLPRDIQLDILYCGICHSDLHIARNEWRSTTYPVVPGHEIVGVVTAVGAEVTRFQPGDRAAVGCIVDSCRTCEYCQEGLEQFCVPGNTIVFDSPDRHLGTQTYGGYAESIVVDEGYVLHMPDGLDLAAAAPLLCAGITTYSPLRHWGVGSGTQVGIAGLGGLGHLAIKIAKAMGAFVVVYTTSAAKVADIQRLGADDVVLSTDRAQMKRYSKSLHLVLDTISGDHQPDMYLRQLRVDGTLVLVGAPMEPLSVSSFNLISGRRRFAGSNIGGIAETQEMLDFCAAHQITADIELISIQQLNEAYERLLRSDVRYRFVIDMASLRA
ncbi:MAG: NAD(P)-dependent alcohol dehydrogenase [Bacteroidia bacterium]|nr:NAD(P)-dependent alcohol dehydrogenase [Bacteroidia bacterium]